MWLKNLQVTIGNCVLTKNVYCRAIEKHSKSTYLKTDVFAYHDSQCGDLRLGIVKNCIKAVVFELLTYGL